jgi:phosphoribosyl-ATP pyrophosphohydrolase
MISRLARNSNGDRRQTLPAAPVQIRFKDCDDAKARTVLVADAAASHSSDRQSSLHPVRNELDRLYAALETVTPENHPRTARLLGSSNRKVAQKVIEEAGEVALAAVKHNARNVVRESADLLYHLAVLWRRTGIGPAEIWTEMRRRSDCLGIAEKLPKANA